MRTVDAEEVLNAISRYAREDGYINLHIGTIDSIISNVSTVKRPHGEWKPKQMLVVGNGAVLMHDGFECECGRVVAQEENFCPECGADMREGEAE